MKKNDEVNNKVVPEQEAQEALEGLTNSEAHNLNQKRTLTALDGTDGVSQLVEGVASGTSPTIPIQQYKDAVRKALEREYLQFMYAQSMGAWKSWAYVGHVEKQLNLTNEQARAAQDEVFEEFGKSADPGDWNIFLNGTPEQRKALQDAIACEMYGDPDGLDGAEPASRNGTARPEQNLPLRRQDTVQNQSEEPYGVKNDLATVAQAETEDHQDSGQVDLEDQTTHSTAAITTDEHSGEKLVLDPATLMVSIGRAVVEPIAKIFELSEPNGFCWVGMPTELKALLKSLPDAPTTIKVPVLLVLFDRRRVELHEGLPVQIQRDGPGIKTTLVNQSVMAIKVGCVKPSPEDTLETLGNAVRSAGYADSEIFVQVTVQGKCLEVDGWITASEAKAHRPSYVIDKPAAA